MGGRWLAFLDSGGKSEISIPFPSSSSPPGSSFFHRIRSDSGLMGSSPRLLGRQRSVHQILGGGFVADVVLWRRSNVTISILLGMLGAWLVFQVSGYTLLSLVSNVLLLLSSILFVWAKAAAVLNRPLPPIPVLHLSEELANEAKVFVHSHVNTILLGFQDIALGKDSKLFYKVAACLWLISVVGSWTDFLTFGYTCLVVVLTAPAAYEKFEDSVDGFLMLACVELRHHGRLYAEYFNNAKNWIIEQEKKSN